MKKSKILFTVGLCTMLLATGCKSSESSTSKYSEYVTLGEYKGIEVNIDSTDVTDDEVTEKIDTNLADSATYTDVTGRAVQDGDQVNIDYVGTVDGEEFDGGSAEAYDLVIGSGSFVDDFEEQLVGSNIGDEVEVNVTFPENYSNADLANVDAVFNVKINNIQEQITPELTDEWVAENSDYTTVSEYTDSVKADLVASKEEAAAKKKTSDVLTKIVENSTISGYPQEEIDAYIDNMESYYESYASYFGMEMDEFLESSFGMTRDEFNTEAETVAKETIGRQMICLMIADAEGMTVSDEEYEEGLQAYTTDYGYETTDAFLAEYSKDIVVQNLLLEKVLDFVSENAVEV